MNTTRRLQNQAVVKYPQFHVIPKPFSLLFKQVCNRLAGTSLLLIIILIFTPATSFSQTVTEADSLALVRLYERLNGENWHEQSGWLKAPVA